MKKQFKKWEILEKDHTLMLQEVLDNLSFNESGLIPAIAQQFDSKQVLMMAWMNKESLIETLKTGHVCYYSRSRQCLWRKGESSGHKQYLQTMQIDCDGDTLLLQVNQIGSACHTMRPDCFYFTVDSQKEHVLVTRNATTQMEQK